MLRTPARILVCGASLALGFAGAAWAQQYESEARVIPSAEAQPAEEFDPQKALDAAKTDPYAQAMILRTLAQQAASVGDSQAAAGYLKRALALNALSEFAAQEMQRELALLLADSGDYEAVIANLAPALAREKDPDPAALMVLAGAYANLGRFTQAQPLVERALSAARKPESDWYALAGAVQMGVGHWREAASNYHRALEGRPDELQYWQQLSAAYLRLDLPLKALAAMELAFRQGLFEAAEDRVQFAQLFLANGVPFEAASLIQSGIEEGVIAREPAVLEMLAGAWVAARENILALPVLEEAAKASGKASLYLQLGQISYDLGDWERATEALGQALKRGAGKHAGTASIMQGVALYQLQQFGAARSSFARAKDYRGSDEIANQWIAYLDSGLAREEALRMAARAPQDEDYISGRFGGPSVRLGGRGRPGAPRFTPIGAEAGPNADGTIPRWEGGLGPDRLPSGHPRNARIPDPYPDDVPLFVITADNFENYGAHLSLGHQHLLKTHDDYRMPVFATRRSVSYPEPIYAATKENRRRAKLLGSDALTGARLGFPFPSPENGVEIMWNHRVRYRGNSVVATTRQAVVEPDGDLGHQMVQTERVYYRYANLNDPIDLRRSNILLYYLTYMAPRPGPPDFVALVHETANSDKQARAIWVLPKGISKLFRIPPVGYDQPFPGSGGIAFVDMVDMYNGGFDRYDWRLLGKREAYLAYNAYRLNDGQGPDRELLTPRFMNPADARYELHRVWVIEASERGGKRHSFGARRFYVDEDSWNVVLVENYDREGRLWRFQEGHLVPYYDHQWANSAPVVTYDFKDGRYFINRLTNETGWGDIDSDEIEEREFRPAMVKARYAR